jgi:hypothetical protein
MRICFLSLLLAVCVSLSAMADVVARFAPLADDERFAYSLQDIKDENGQHMRIDLVVYAVKNDDVENAAELFTWERNTRDFVQFTSDFRTAFFNVWSEGTYTLLKADGTTGEITVIASDVVGGRISTDGRFYAFIDFRRLSDYEKANIVLFDVENEAMTHLEWRPKRPVYGGWSLFRFGNIFRIYGIIDSGGSPAAAAIEMNPETMEITVLWDKTDIDNWLELSPPLPEISGDDSRLWQDDVFRQYHDPNIRLRR